MKKFSIALLWLIVTLNSVQIFMGISLKNFGIISVISLMIIGAVSITKTTLEEQLDETKRD